MTKKQILWASDHDWYRGRNDLGGIYAYDSSENKTVLFYNFQKLKAWAGY